MAILTAGLTFLSTLFGGLVGLRYRDDLHLILGFTSGVLVAVVAFDLLPEIIRLVVRLNVPPVQPMIALVTGFLVFHIVEKVILIHNCHEDCYPTHHHPLVGKASALALAGHSFLDGVGIGLGFQVSTTAGVLVAIAVIAHDFSDGLNTVSLVIVNRNPSRTALAFLLLDAVTPVLGAASTLLIKIPDNLLLLYLGFFAGFLLYIGASDILPEAHREHSSYGTLAMTVIGVVFIYGVTRVI